MPGMALCILSSPAWRTRRQLTWIETYSEPLSLTEHRHNLADTGELAAEATSRALGCVTGQSLSYSIG